MLRHARRLSAKYAGTPAQTTQYVRPFSATAPVNDPSSSSQPQDIAILGGGITGLAAAYYATQRLPGAHITVYEASERLGGWLSSSRVPVKNGSVLFEAGPRTLRPQGHGVMSARLLQELDLAKDAIFAQRSSPAAQSRYVYFPDRLVRMPHPAFGIAENFWSLLTEPVFKTALWSGVREVFAPARDRSIQDESVGDFFSRRFSSTVVDRLISAILHGIYAGDAWQLSAKSLFPTAWRDELTSGSLITGMLRTRADGAEITKSDLEYNKAIKKWQWDPLLRATLNGTSVFTFREGLGMIPDALVRHLSQSGQVTFKTSSPVKSLSWTKDTGNISVSVGGADEAQTHTQVISALSPWHLNSLSPHRDSPLIPDIPTVTVMTVNLFFRTPNLNPPGFGYLIPQGISFDVNPERALGVVFDSAVSPTPTDVDASNWQISDVEQLKSARESGQLVNVNDFAWYNMPNKPNVQDDLTSAGTKLTVMLGGHWWDGWPAYPDEQEGLALAKSILARHLGITEEPEAWRVNLQKDCIPQYTVGHEQRLKLAHNNIWAEYKGKLRVAGNWMSGAGVNDCLKSAYDVIRNLSAGRSGTGLEHIGNTDYVRVKPVIEQENSSTR